MDPVGVLEKSPGTGRDRTATFPFKRLEVYCVCFWAVGAVAGMIAVTVLVLGQFAASVALIAFLAIPQAIGFWTALGTGRLGIRWASLVGLSLIPIIAVAIPVLALVFLTAVAFDAVDAGKATYNTVKIFIVLFATTLFGAACNSVAMKLLSTLFGLGLLTGSCRHQPRVSVADWLVLTGAVAVFMGLLNVIVQFINAPLDLDPMLATNLSEKPEVIAWNSIAISLAWIAGFNLLVSIVVTFPLTLFCLSKDAHGVSRELFWGRVFRFAGFWGLIGVVLGLSIGSVESIPFYVITFIGLVFAVAMPISWTTPLGLHFIRNRAARRVVVSGSNCP